MTGMGLEIILYDTSPVVQKIFSHILYHYAPAIYRTHQPGELIARMQSRRPDMVFMDYAASRKMERDMAGKVEGVLKDIPVILISGDDMDAAGQVPLSKAVLKKPIQADQLMKLVNRFVPKTKSHLLKDHLHFPSMPDFAENEQSKAIPEDNKGEPASQKTAEDRHKGSLSRSLDRSDSGIQMESDSESDIDMPSIKSSVADIPGNKRAGFKGKERAWD